METRLAKVISYLFHPLLIPLVTLLLIFQLQTLQIMALPSTVKWLVLGMLVLATIAFPLLSVMLFIRRGWVRTIHMEGREERLYPYLVVCVVYYVVYLMLSSTPIPMLVTRFILGVSLLMLLVLIINFRFKISIHMVAVGGMTGAFTALAIRYNLNLVWLIALSVFISGMLGFARLKLNAHQHSEVYSGWLIGAAGMILMYLLF